MKKSIILLSICLLQYAVYGQEWHTIPAQKLPLYKLNSISDSNKYNLLFDVKGFEISSQITLGLYKKYLSDVIKDSGYKYNLTQLPDSSITSLNRYMEYVNNPVYENSPVAGISWDAAMNFCKWMMIKNNPVDSIVFIYTLPKISYWLAAKYFLDSNKIGHDFSKYFSDWTTGLYYEGAYGFGEFSYDIEYYAKKTEPPRNKRKLVVGNNFMFMPNYEVLQQGGYYQYKGFRYVSFRVIRQKLNRNDKSHLSLMKYLNLIK